MKKYLILAVIFIILGGLILTMTACSANWNFETFFGNSFEEKELDVKNSFDSVEIYTDTADITLIPSEDGKCRIVTNDRKKIEYTASSDNGVLKIKSVDKRKWYERIFDFGTPTLTAYLPKTDFNSLVIDESTGNVSITNAFRFGNVDIRISTGEVTLENVNADSLSIKTSTGKMSLNEITCNGDVNLKVSTGDSYLRGISCKNLISKGSTGDITIENLTAYENAFVERTTAKVGITDSTVGGNLDIEVSTGKSNLSGIRCANLTSDGDTGYISLTDVIAEGKFDIERGTGDVNFNACDAAEIYVETDTGDVKGTFLSDKVYIVFTDTGKINVPKTVTGGRCEISTDTGNIKIEIEQ